MARRNGFAKGAVKGADRIFVVEPVDRTELPIRRVTEPQDLQEPLELKNRIAGNHADKVLPLLDSRTRYWRYYLLIGPRPRWAYRTLGNQLLAVVRQNRRAKDQSATRGVGRDLFNSCCLGLRRPPSDPELKRLVRNFRNQYGAAANSFWEYVRGKQGEEVLREASHRLRKTNSFAGFFSKRLKEAPDGHARSAYHRITRYQTKAGEELAWLVRRGRTLSEAIASVKRTTLHADETKRLVLAWALLASLYEPQHGRELPRVRYDDDGETDDDEETVFEGIERKLAHVARLLLQDGVGDLDEDTRRDLIARLEEALRHRPYHPPCRVSTVTDSGSRRRLFADLRLTSLRRLLEQTS